MEDVVGKGVSSAAAAYQLGLQNESTKAEIAYKDAAIIQSTAQAAQAVTSAKKAEQETKGVIIDNAAKKYALPATKKEADLREVTADYDKSAAGYDAIMNRALGAIGGLTSAAGKFFRPQPTGDKADTLRRENKTMKDYINRNQGRRK